MLDFTHVGKIWFNEEGAADDYQRFHFDQRFTDLEKIWDEKLLRVDRVMDARLKHPEERSK